jgi:hypothetical protein
LRTSDGSATLERGTASPPHVMPVLSALFRGAILPDETPPPPEPDGDPVIKPRDEATYALVGKIISRWSDIHEQIHADISHIQQRFRVAKLHKYGANAGKAPEKHFAPGRFDEKLKYYRRLFKLALREPERIGFLERTTQKIKELYKIRNDLAHGKIGIHAFWEEPPTVSIKMGKWTDEWQKEWSEWLDLGPKPLGSDGRPPRPPKPLEKKYSFKELEAVPQSMIEILWDLGKILAWCNPDNMPDEEPPAPPKEKSKRMENDGT